MYHKVPLATKLVALILCFLALEVRCYKVSSGYINTAAGKYFYSLTSGGYSGGACLALWINGGLGTSSFLGYFGGIGPYR